MRALPGAIEVEKFVMVSQHSGRCEIFVVVDLGHRSPGRLRSRQ
jgi:hypothetical protein